QRYFGTTAAGLSLDQAALLAGLVENPSLYDPVTNPAAAVQRRNLVLARMAQLRYISQRAAAAAAPAPLGLHYSAQPPRDGCAGAASTTGWLPNYVRAEMRTATASSWSWHEPNTTGGMTIRATMTIQDQAAAQRAVSFMLPTPPCGSNPGRNAAA